MGTRSLTHIMEDDKVLLTMYGQHDGYISGHGKELAEFVKSGKLVNGYGGSEKQFNGLGCLAAQVVAHFKDGVGGYYIEPAGTKNCGEEYTYIIYEVGRTINGHNVSVPGELYIRVAAGPMTFFGMDLTQNDQSDDVILYDGPVTGYDVEQLERKEEEYWESKSDSSESEDESVAF